MSDDHALHVQAGACFVCSTDGAEGSASAVCHMCMMASLGLRDDDRPSAKGMLSNSMLMCTYWNDAVNRACTMHPSNAAYLII